jgi:putative nucleotidyltransferase with HDIG domain
VTLEKLVNSSTELASLPDVCIRLNAGIDDPHFAATDLAEILLLDTALSTVLLKIVNSAFYSFSTPIETISRAITVVGINDLRNLIFAASAVGAFKNIASDLVDMNDFWIHSLYTAVSARCLAKHYSVLHPERLFVMGLLHDVGHLIMYHQMPKESSDVLMRAETGPDLLSEIEKDVFGYTHAQVGAELLKKWRLPDSIVEGVGNHHRTIATGNASIESNIIYIANQMTAVLERGEALELLMEKLNFGKMAVSDISEKKMQQLIQSIPELFAESKSIITPMAI